MLSKVEKNKKSSEGYIRVRKCKDISEYRLTNGLTVLYKRIRGTGVVTTNITYKVGSRDEEVGQTGLAHMLEHMLFKPTKNDLKKKIDSGAMQFERETGSILNATTWKDRTTYFFSYPKEYVDRALSIEADRMEHVVISDVEFLPEQGNVLSEFDMLMGDPHFALCSTMLSTAFFSHPYGHETIGFREDIERFTAQSLTNFYELYYVPQNATLMIIGDIEEEDALQKAVLYFGNIRTKRILPSRVEVVEPKQEGIRRVEVKREAISNLVALGVKHEGFPSKEWFTTMALFSILTNGQDSILHKQLVDSGLAISVEGMTEPSKDTNLGIVLITLSSKSDHTTIEKIVRNCIQNLTVRDVQKHYKKVQQRLITDELLGRGSSLQIAMELTEYVSADAWEKYFETEEILKSITATDIVKKASSLFREENLTVGYFIGNS